MDKIYNTITFLGSFTPSKAFKQVTHTFDADSEGDYLDYVNRCRTALLNYEGLLPDGLYNLLFGFFFGPEWTDADGGKHTEFCGCSEWVNWCLNNPGVHPLSSSDSFRKNILAFKKSIRVYDGELPSHLAGISGKNIVIDLDIRKLKNVDAYMDVAQLKKVIISIINDIDTTTHAREHNVVRITAFREKNELPGDVVIDTVSIEHIGSYPSKSLDSAMAHFRGTGGFLSSLKNDCEGYFFLSVDTAWNEGKPVRWNLLREEGRPETEDLPDNEPSIQGFRYNIRIPHKR